MQQADVTFTAGTTWALLRPGSVWDQPDPSIPARYQLETGTVVFLLAEPWYGWAQVRSAHGDGWIDARLLGAVPPGGTAPVEPHPPPPSIPVALLEQATRRCTAVLISARAGELDERTARAQLLEHGIVRSDEGTWFLDLRGKRWCLHDGIAVRGLPLLELATRFDGVADARRG